MTHNMGKLDRIARITAGVALIGAGFFVAGTVGTVLTVVGFVPLITGLVGNCPLYGVCHIDTRQHS
ncbi:MAG: DUF2892 domain-containing protein [Nitrospina sp.]|nr:DUF2892 domain-containing protein [Nitrospina sp.]